MTSVYQFYARFRYKLEGLPLRIFDLRTVARFEEPMTLDAIGRKEGLTRERIRQVEKSIRDNFEIGLRTCELDQVKRLLSQSQESVTPIAAEDFLRAAGWPYIPRDEHQLATSLVSALGLGEVRCGKVFAGSIEEFCKLAVRKYHEEKTDTESASQLELSAFERFLEEELWGPELISNLDLKQILKDSVPLKRDGATAQIRNFLIERPGEAHSLDSLIATLNLEKNSKRGLAGALANTDISRSLDGGYVFLPGQKQTYVSTSELISEFLQSRPDQSASFGEVVAFMETRRTLTKSSLRAACGRLPFQLIEGKVSFATTPRKVRKSPFLTKNLFYDPNTEVWRLRVSVGDNELRGLPVKLPNALVTVLRLAGGKNPFRVLPLNVEGTANWNSKQLVFSTLRPHLLEVSAVLGDTVFLEFDTSHVLTISRCGPISREPGVRRVMAYAGFDRDEHEDVLVQALGLKTLGLSLEELLRKRGELHLLF